MTEEQRKPLVLVVDDVPEYRQDLVPAMAETLGCRSVGACTVQEAIQIAAEHDSDSDDPIDLAIIDMHMPFDEEDATKIVEDGGTQCLQAIAQFRLLRFPCVVFTAFPSFTDCVAATRAGADAYIPKVRRDNEGGPEALRETCERLLQNDEHVTEAPPTRAWIEKNHGWLTRNFNGKWVAFVSSEDVSGTDIPRDAEQDGVILLAGDSYEDVRAKVLKFPSALQAQPVILMVRGKQSASDEAKG